MSSTQLPRTNSPTRPRRNVSVASTQGSPRTGSNPSSRAASAEPAPALPAARNQALLQEDKRIKNVAGKPVPTPMSTNLSPLFIEIAEAVDEHKSKHRKTTLFKILNMISSAASKAGMEKKREHQKLLDAIILDLSHGRNFHASTTQSNFKALIEAFTVREDGKVVNVEININEIRGMFGALYKKLSNMAIVGHSVFKQLKYKDEMYHKTKTATSYKESDLPDYALNEIGEKAKDISMYSKAQQYDVSMVRDLCK